MEQQSKQTGKTAASRTDYLLGLLSKLSQDDPPPALRGRLELASSRRLRNEVASEAPVGRTRLRLVPVFAVAVLIAIGMIAAFVAYSRRPAPLQTKIAPRVIAPIAPAGRAVDIPLAVPSPGSPSPSTRHALRRLARYNPSQRMTVRLPYSDSAIDTGTDATIQVSMSQAELVSLGFPMNTALHDRRVVADLTLGDDGLPRAISVSLPLEVIKEKK
jgi:hypothetical protein